MMLNSFRFHNPSSRTMVLGFTQLLTENRTSRYFWGKALPTREADNLTAFYELDV
jgi:hypothetical protein